MHTSTVSNEPATQGDGSSEISSVRSAWSILAHGAPTAADALVTIAGHGKSEIARVQASQAILDRVGLAPPKEVTFRVMPESGPQTQQLSPAEVIRNRLKALAAPPAEQPVDTELLPEQEDSWDTDGVVDAELVPLDDDADNGWS